MFLSVDGFSGQYSFSSQLPLYDVRPAATVQRTRCLTEIAKFPDDGKSWCYAHFLSAVRHSLRCSVFGQTYTNTTDLTLLKELRFSILTRQSTVRTGESCEARTYNFLTTGACMIEALYFVSTNCSVSEQKNCADPVQLKKSGLKSPLAMRFFFKLTSLARFKFLG